MWGENGAQTLLIDADDTLWENNIYFERAIAKFISFVDHREHSPEAVRLVLNDVERESIVKHGYGLHSFAHSLVETFEKLSVDPVTPDLHERIRSFAHQIADHPIEASPTALSVELQTGCLWSRRRRVLKNLDQFYPSY